MQRMVQENTDNSDLDDMSIEELEAENKRLKATQSGFSEGGL